MIQLLMRTKIRWTSLNSSRSSRFRLNTTMPRIVSGVSRLTIVRALLSYAKGKYRSLPQYITFVRTRHLEIDAAESEVINVDGEAEYGSHVVFDLIPGGVNFIFPKGLAFFD